MNFKRKGFKSVVLADDFPKLFYAGNNFEIDEQAQKIFLEDYKNIYPLISVIIPTFNRAKYFQQALESVLSQTYRNFEIVVSDDGTNDDTEILMQNYLQKYSNIKYFRNRGFTSHDNWNFLRKYNNPEAEYVQWLMDDDLFYPRKFERMVEVYRNNPTVSCVTSSKNAIDKDDNIIGGTQSWFPQDVLMNSAEAAKLLFNWGNFIGEPTTVLIRKKFLRDNDLCWNEDETGFYSLCDVSTWLQLLSQGNLYRLSEILSAQRVHSEQSTNWSTTGILFNISYAKLFRTALDKKLFFNTDAEKYTTAMSLIMKAADLMTKADEEKRQWPEFKTLEKIFAALAASLTNDFNFEMPEIEYSEQDDVKKMN